MPNFRALLPLLTATGLFAGLQSAKADIHFSLQADLLKASNGQALSQNGLFLLVASTADSSFSISNQLAAGSSTAIGTFLGADDMIVYRGSLSGSGVNGVLSADFTLNPNASAYGGVWNAGDRLALLWFSSLTLASATLTEGAEFGFYDGGQATAPNVTDANSSGVDGSQNWVTPNNPTLSHLLGFYTNDSATLGPGSGSANDASAGLATGLVVVPEPTVGLLALAGLGAVLGSRRRRA